MMKNPGNYGFITSYLLIGLLVVGIAVGAYLIQNRTNFLPRADINQIEPQVSYSLKNTATSDIQTGTSFRVNILINSDFDQANLFIAKLKFNPQFLEVVEISNSFPESKIQTLDSYLKNWIEKKYDNSNGMISLIAGVPAPGLKTAPEKRAILATVTFRAKMAGSTDITFEDTSRIYRNTDNVNILNSKQDLLLVIKKSRDEEAKNGKLILTPSSAPLSKGCNYQISINYETGISKIDGIDVILLYDPAQIEVTSLDKGVFASYPGNVINQNEGKIYMSGLAIPGKPVTGRGLLGKVNFKVKPDAVNGLTEINFKFDPDNPDRTDDTNIVETGGVRDIIGSVINGRYNIQSGSCNPISGSNIGDGNNDGIVDFMDMSMMLSNYKKPSSTVPNLDFNGDNAINIFDLTQLIQLIVS